MRYVLIHEFVDMEFSDDTLLILQNVLLRQFLSVNLINVQSSQLQSNGFLGLFENIYKVSSEDSMPTN